MKIVTTNEAAGTATVEIDGKRRDLKAAFQGDHITVYGIAIRYPTGSKIWFGSLHLLASHGAHQRNHDADAAPGPVCPRERSWLLRGRRGGDP
jgi:hypothetical protein